MGYSFTGTVGGAVVSVSTAEADVAIIPDFDGDGIPDIILSSAWKPVPGLGNAGVIHIISGAALASLDALVLELAGEGGEPLLTLRRRDVD